MRLLALTLLAACSSPADPADDIVDTPSADTVDPVDTPEDTVDPVDTPTVDTPTADTPADPTPDLPDDPCYAQVPVVRIGTGGEGFLPITAGQDLEMVHGLQGGWHMWVSVRAENVASLVIQQVRIVDVATGVEVTNLVSNRSNLALAPLVPGPWACDGVHYGSIGLLDVLPLTGDPALTPAALCGREVELTVTLRDPRGAQPVIGTDSVTVTAQPDPIDGPHCATPNVIPEPDTDPPAP